MTTSAMDTGVEKIDFGGLEIACTAEAKIYSSLSLLILMLNIRRQIHTSTRRRVVEASNQS